MVISRVENESRTVKLEESPYHPLAIVSELSARCKIESARRG